MQRFFARLGQGIPTPPVDPEPEPEPIIENAGGWADLHPSGLVTGGLGGDRLYFNENSLVNGKEGWEALWETISINRPTPLELWWTGPDILCEPKNYDFGGGNNFTNKPENKTIFGTAGQELRGGSFRPRGWRNIIWRNFKRRGDGLGGEEAGLIHGGNGLSFVMCERIWIDHMEFDSEATVPGTEQLKDGPLDFGVACDHITVSNCYIRRNRKTSLVSWSDTAIEDRGKERITFRNCLWENNMIRQPFARFGKIHLLNNVFRYVPVFTASATQYAFANIPEIGFESQFYSQRNKYYGHRYCFFDRDWNNPSPLSGLISDEDWFDPNPTFSSFNGNGSQYKRASFRSANVTFNPNTIEGYHYPLGLMTVDEAEAYVLQWAGAKYHLKNPIV
jgi:pectate lyase